MNILKERICFKFYADILHLTDQDFCNRNEIRDNEHSFKFDVQANTITILNGKEIETSRSYRYSNSPELMNLLTDKNYTRIQDIKVMNDYVKIVDLCIGNNIRSIGRTKDKTGSREDKEIRL